MSDQEDANVSEALNDMYQACGQLLEEFKLRSEGTQEIVQLFRNIVQDDKSLHSFSNNHSLRAAVRNNVENIINLNQQYDPAFIKRLQIIQTECMILARLIEQANKEGAKIK